MGDARGRCGYTVSLRDIPEEIAASYPDSDTWYTERRAVCCWRDAWAESDDGYCLWHAQVADKSATQLAAARTTGPERLDGAYLQTAAVGDRVSFSECALLGSDCRGADLREADLARANLRSADLTATQLWNADLTGAQCWRATLREATLVNADLTIADLVGADLTAARLLGADLTGANLRNARMEAADLVGATLTGADLRRAELTDADLEGATLRNATLRDADLSGADLRDVDLAGADLRHVELTGADLTGATLAEANLFEADATAATLRRADLRGARLRDADLTHGDLSEASLRRAGLATATLSGASLVRADMRRTELDGADLSSADLRDATVTGATLRSADLTDADLSDATLTRANLTRTKLFGTDCSNTTFHDTQLYDARLRDLHISGETDFGRKNVYERRVDGLAPPVLRTRLRAGAARAHLLAERLAAPDAGRGDPARQTLAATDGPAEPSTILARLWQGLATWLYWYRRRPDAALDTDDGTEQRSFEITQLNKSVSVYKDVEQLCRENGLPGEVPTHYVRRKHAERKRALINDDRWRWLNLAGQRWIMKYGEGPWRIVVASLVVIVASALVYPLTGGIVGGPTAEPTRSVITMLYFSIITFATLGYGDFQPVGTAARTVAGIESLMGAMLIALLVAVSARRMMR